MDAFEWFREITVQIGSAAIQGFRAASLSDRSELEARFVRMDGTQLADEQYDEQRPPAPQLIVRISSLDL